MLKISLLSTIVNHKITFAVIYFLLSLIHFYLTGSPLSF
ncbi:Uncharacterised protein [Klebsiella pneumoniae]|jgi:hypothetical protein|uniref:Uncharacterized protein n=1 Tax=Klebsiella pneumoniae TaxID=573 RepID=A0A486QE70_KLEPN|nr:hypothetical protein Kpn23412_2046 [Klebsiella pneumoniae subsp. pneumoniae]CAE7607808.1 hypothetical protein AI2773V2_1970 [Klebsiella pneumoniae]CAF3204917.1 hypothetical protein AI3010V1_1870 [Klebsiella quasipneumoniae]VGP34956.1 hypothetical protein SB00001_03826 [Klebsiella variicola]CAH4132622.1 hypothetical protein AI2773V2_1970 [Klebsiella pneumoniae]